MVVSFDNNLKSRFPNLPSVWGGGHTHIPERPAMRVLGIMVPTYDATYPLNALRINPKGG